MSLNRYDQADIFPIAEGASLVSETAIPAPRRKPPKSWEEAGGCDNYFTSVAGSLRARGFSHEAILAALTAENANLDDPLEDSRIERIAKSVSRYEPKERRFFACSDYGNAERFAHHNPDIRYSPELETWFYWNGIRWAKDPGGSVAAQQAMATVRGILHEAEACEDSEIRKAILGWARKSEAAERLSAVLRVARSLQDVVVKATAFDTDPWILNVENGILDLRSGDLKSHARGAMCSALAPVRFVPGARHEVLDRYLKVASGGDAEFEAFLQRAVGYSLTGDAGAESLFLLLGPGGSGKTTLVEAIKDMMGDYAATMSAKTIVEKRSESGHSSDIARLLGKRLVITSEIKKGKRLDAELVKSLTGGERIVARQIYEADAEFSPQAKFWVAANHTPAVDNDDSGMWRRLLRLPFDKPIPEADRDPAIKATLRNDPAARSALLAWGLQGCLDWQSRGKGRQGLAVPARVLEATKEYQEEQDPLRDFLDECCELKNGTAPVSSVRRAYADYCRACGVHPMPPHELNRRLELRGCQRTVEKDKDRKCYKAWNGIILVSGNASDEHI